MRRPHESGEHITLANLLSVLGAFGLRLTAAVALALASSFSNSVVQAELKPDARISRPAVDNLTDGGAADSTSDRVGPTGICATLEKSASANDIPVDFFVRLIWQESRFDPKSVSRAGALGIAQFMPATARLRGLADPFDPDQAIPKSAELLRDLIQRFGNPGLAAAAYNAGPRRVDDWLAGRRTLPRETRAYVRIITGQTAEQWIAPTESDEEEAPGRCESLATLAAKEEARRAVRLARAAAHSVGSAESRSVIARRDRQRVASAQRQHQRVGARPERPSRSKRA